MDDNIVTKRTSVPLIKKIEAAEEYLRLKRNGLFGVKELARELNLQPAQIRQYAANLSNHRSKLYESRKTYTTLRTGRRSQLYDIENEVVTWIMELRNEGMPVSTNLVVMKARSLMPNEFNNKNEMTQYQAVSRMLKRHNIVIRSKTNEAQRAPAEVRAEGDAYVKGLVNRLQGPHRDKRWIANMDQTPLFFSMTPKRTLDKRGLRTVNVRKSSSSTMRVTMVEWAVSSLNSISEQIIKNAWRLSNYDYFPNEPKENDTTNNDEETETEVEMLDFSETEAEVEMLDISDAEIDELHDVEIEAI